MFKRFLKNIVSASLSIVALSSFWDLPYYGPSLFFFGEPEFPSENKNGTD